MTKLTSHKIAKKTANHLWEMGYVEADRLIEVEAAIEYAIDYALSQEQEGD